MSVEYCLLGFLSLDTIVAIYLIESLTLESCKDVLHIILLNYALMMSKLDPYGCLQV